MFRFAFGAAYIVGIAIPLVVDQFGFVSREAESASAPAIDGVGFLFAVLS